VVSIIGTSGARPEGTSRYRPRPHERRTDCQAPPCCKRQHASASRLTLSEGGHRRCALTWSSSFDASKDDVRAEGAVTDGARRVQIARGMS
jgi:hypothetical protein